MHPLENPKRVLEIERAFCRRWRWELTVALNSYVYLKRFLAFSPVVKPPNKLCVPAARGCMGLPQLHLESVLAFLSGVSRIFSHDNKAALIAMPSTDMLCL